MTHNRDDILQQVSQVAQEGLRPVLASNGMAEKVASRREEIQASKGAAMERFNAALNPHAKIQHCGEVSETVGVPTGGKKVESHQRSC